MKYIGSKARFSNEILSIILKDRKPQQWYVEPFCGGCNMIDKVSGNRLANDIHPYLISMWEHLVYKSWIPTKITKEEYMSVKNAKETHEPYFVGWIGFNCSYSGKYFGGFAGETKTKLGTIRDYQTEAIKNVIKQVENLKGVVFSNKNYFEIEIPPNSIVYCDPPYRDTTSYANKIDYDLFWNWIRNISKQGHTVYVSEYSAPDDFECVWEKEVKSSLSANGKVGGNKVSTEKIFRLK